MRLISLTCTLGLILFFSNCKKETFISSKDASLTIGADTLHFDTVFTSVGSVTQSFKIFNNNDQKLLLSNVQLMGGSASYFKLNLDGSQGTAFSNIELAANDSIYAFVTVNINPNASQLPFVIRDSIKIEFNGNTAFVQLEAYGRNAFFLKDWVISKDTTWTNKYPIVLLGNMRVDSGAVLNITSDTKIYVHANSTINVNGTLNATGKNNGGGDSGRIVFQGDRLDYPYKYYPSSWPGINFNKSSINNVLTYCVIKNAYQGVIVNGLTNNSIPKLALNECIFDNIYDIAISGSNTSITARNCLVSNSGSNVSLTSGGDYTFDYCTLVSYGNSFVEHKKPVLTLSNTNADNILNDLKCSINNSIVYGDYGTVDNEISLNKATGKTFDIKLNNVLYKSKTTLNASNATLINCISNQSPMFVSVNTGTRNYDFRLASGSPCLAAGDKGLPLVNFDLDGTPRNKPDSLDIGCYQFNRK